MYIKSGNNQKCCGDDACRRTINRKRQARHRQKLKVSKPVNKRLFEIFKTCGFVEESGHGVPTVTKAYGDDSYIFDGKFIKVVIPFDRSGFANTIKENPSTTQETTQEKIINLLKFNSTLTRRDLATLLKITDNGVKYHLNQLKKKGIIEHHGATKAGYWEVKE